MVGTRLWSRKGITVSTAWSGGNIGNNIFCEVVLEDENVHDLWRLVKLHHCLLATCKISNGAVVIIGCSGASTQALSYWVHFSHFCIIFHVCSSLLVGSSCGIINSLFLWLTTWHRMLGITGPSSQGITHSDMCRSLRHAAKACTALTWIHWSISFPASNTGWS